MARLKTPHPVSEVLAIVRDLAREGMAMPIATHEMGFAREVASKGPPERIFTAPESERTRAFLKSIIEAGRL